MMKDSLGAIPGSKASPGAAKASPPIGYDPGRDGDLPRCYGCLGPVAVEDGLCRDCWNDLNGQFGVGA